MTTSGANGFQQEKFQFTSTQSHSRQSVLRDCTILKHKYGYQTRYNPTVDNPSSAIVPGLVAVLVLQDGSDVAGCDRLLDSVLTTPFEIGRVELGLRQP